MPRTELEATARNIFEAADNPTITDFIMLLSEEWTDDQIGRSMDTAEPFLGDTIKRHEFQVRCAPDILRALMRRRTLAYERRTVMGKLGTLYPRRDMQRVFSVLSSRLPATD